MPFQPIQQFHEYLTQPWSEVRKAVKSLVDLAMLFGDKTRDDAVWKHAVELNNWMDYIVGEGAGDLSVLEKQLAGMLDADMAFDFVESTQKMDKMLQAQNGMVGGQTGALGDLSSKLAELGLNEDTKQRWTSGVLALTGENRQSAMTAIDELVNLEGEVYYQLYQISMALGFVLPKVRLYTVDEIRDILFQESEKVSFPVLARSLVEYTRGDSWHDMAAVAFGLLDVKFYRERVDYSWDDAFIFTILLHIIFARFENLPDENWKFSIQNYIYRAIVAGVPVRQKIGDALYTTRNMVDYVLVDKMLFEALKAGAEQVVVDIEKNISQPLSEILGKYQALMDKSGAEGYNTEKFIQETFGAQKNREAYMAWLREILYIFLHLKNLNLIDHNYGGELAPSDLYFNDMVELVANFGIGKDGSDFIVGYFSKPDKRVPLVGFLRRLEEIVNLGDNVAVENCIELSSALKDAGLISEAEDLLIFDEKTGKFHWNEEILR